MGSVNEPERYLDEVAMLASKGKAFTPNGAS